MFKIVWFSKSTQVDFTRVFNSIFFCSCFLFVLPVINNCKNNKIRCRYVLVHHNFQNISVFISTQGQFWIKLHEKWQLRNCVIFIWRPKRCPSCLPSFVHMDSFFVTQCSQLKSFFMQPETIIWNLYVSSKCSNVSFSKVLKVLPNFIVLYVELATLSLVWICLLYIVEDFFVIHHRLMAFSQIRNLDILFFLYTWYYVGHISRIIIFGWHTYG